MNSISTQLLNSALDLSLFHFILTILSCAFKVGGRGTVPLLNYDNPFKGE